MQARQVFKTLAAVTLLLSSQVSLAADYVFTNVNVITMESPQVLEQQAVIVRDQHIYQVLPMAEFSAEHNSHVIDARGQYLIPGLAEMHGHVPPTQSDRFPQRYLNDTLFLYLAGGVTTVRGMLGHADQLQLKQDVQSGARLGPNLYLAGPSFNGNSVSSPEQARDMVREHKQAGWDLLKIHPRLELAEFEAVAQQARAEGIDFAGHVPSDVPLDVAMAAGIRTIDHMDGYIEFVGATDRAITEDELETLVNMTIEYNVGIVPTQVLWATLIGAADRAELEQFAEAKYMPASVREGWHNYLDNISNSRYYSGEHADVHQRNRQQLLAALQAGGAEILMGTDAPQVYSVPGLSLFRELEMMADAGMTPYEILYSGTVAVGRYFAQAQGLDEPEFGQVVAGQRADLVLLADNPLETLSTVAEPAGVMVRGRWLSRTMLDEKLAEIEAAYR